MKRPKWPYVGVVLAVLWVFVRGVHLPLDDPVALGSNLGGEFLIGLAVGGAIAYGTRRLYTDTIDLARIPGAVVPAVSYILVFVYELLTANVDVARRVLSPSMPIRPAVIEIPLRVERDAAITSIANSITLTPGTLTMDYDSDRNALYVHAIYCDDPDDLVEPIRKWENYALVIFDEEAKPTDEPDPPVVRREHDGGGRRGG